MATIIINGQEHTIPEDEKLNAIQMAGRVGVDIPYYCWHPALSVVANCRMCEIEVGGKDPKTGEIKMIPRLVPGCQTPAKDLTVIVTDSDGEVLNTSRPGASPGLHLAEQDFFKHLKDHDDTALVIVSAAHTESPGGQSLGGQSRQSQSRQSQAEVVVRQPKIVLCCCQRGFRTRFLGDRPFSFFI